MALCKYVQRHGVRLFSVCCQHLSDKPDLPYKYVQKVKQRKVQLPEAATGDEALLTKFWDEASEIKKYVEHELKKQQNFPHFRDHFVMFFIRMRPIYLNPGGLQTHLQNKWLKRELLKQSFNEDRVDFLGPDLAAAHFILNRGGRIKFWGQRGWITKENKKMLLPVRYVPGLYVVAIDATNTGLYYEGVDCLRYLKKMKWLRLKGLTKLNDFSLDIISGRYGSQLEYLDLSGCTGITHHGLESFYRFQCLKGLNVTGIDTSPEFHMALLMIHDLLPDLDIVGVDFSQYLKEDIEDTKEEPILQIQSVV